MPSTVVNENEVNRQQTITSVTRAGRGGRREERKRRDKQPPKVYTGRGAMQGFEAGSGSKTQVGDCVVIIKWLGEYPSSA